MDLNSFKNGKSRGAQTRLFQKEEERVMHLIVQIIPHFPPYNLTFPHALFAVYLTQTQRSPFIVPYFSAIFVLQKSLSY